MSDGKGRAEETLEVEIKARVDDIQAFEKALQEDGDAHLHEDWHDQSDIYFRHPKRDFAQTDEALRLRIVKNRAILTYKGPKIDSYTKTRVEIEVDVKGDILLLLHNIGFKAVMKVEKRRKVYALENCEICLDDVKGLGTYVEIEARGGDLDEDRERLMELAARLGLKDFERRSYLELILANAK